MYDLMKYSEAEDSFLQRNIENIKASEIVASWAWEDFVNFNFARKRQVLAIAFAAWPRSKFGLLQLL